MVESSYTGSCFINTCTEIRSTIVKKCECVTKDIIPGCLILLHEGGLSLLDKCIHVDQTCLVKILSNIHDMSDEKHVANLYKHAGLKG